MNEQDKVRWRARVAARLAEANFEAEALARVAAIDARFDGPTATLAAAAVARAGNAIGRVFHLRRLAEVLSEAVAPGAPCKKGCHHCCSMPALVHVEEAKVIARQTGAPLTIPAAFWEPFGDKTPLSRFDGVPCPFLDNGSCGIYVQRPYACRMHTTVDRDDVLCEVVAGEPVRVPMMDMTRFDVVYAHAFGDPADARLATLHEFFPSGRDRD